MPLPTPPPASTRKLHDLQATIKQLQEGNSSAQAQLERAIDIAQSSACEHVFLKTMFDEARQQIGHQKGAVLQGLAISVKDLFDVAGQTTAAGSNVLANAPAAAQDCQAVARLKAAGGVIIGRTNMSEFAFSGVGVNPHFGTPANAASSTERRIPGGSSSGAAVSVATGAAFIGLGSDTGGSIRIPAALNGIVGFKNTARLVPTDGALPLSTTLDTVCAMTRSVRDAMLTHEILSAKGITRSLAPLASYRLAVVRPIMQDGLDATVSTAWQRTLKQLLASGAQIQEIDLPQIHELASINATGGFTAAESYAWHHAQLQQHARRYDPRVLARIQSGAGMNAREYIELTAARRQWINRMEQALRGFDAVLSPTVPIVAPLIATVAPGAERDEAFFTVNSLLLRNTIIVNMLDGCAISIPCHVHPELPVGLMIWAPAMADDTVLNIALQVEQLLVTP
jgi:aspartyl-tRNA(Asn)/glutamyl-tRNA(Gln) amidotransferase subunit A